MAPKLKVIRRPKVYSEDYVPKTTGDEVEWLVTQWYTGLGQSIPPEDIGLGARIDAIDRAKFDEECKRLNETPKEVFEENIKPEFGTPAFWAWTYKQKALKNAERAAQGLPPLPTKKEAEAAKEVKATEKARAKAEQIAEKAKKLAEKEATKATKISKTLKN